MFLPFICFILSILLKEVFGGNDLCKNGAKIDSIDYIYDKKLWFFTSGGHYWFVKDNEFPPKEKGKPLSSGLKRGDAALYLNTFDACSKGNGRKEKEIYLIEKTDKGNVLLIFDVRSKDWINKKQPKLYNEDKVIGRARVDWSEAIDAMVSYKNKFVVIVQKDKYNVIDFSKICKNSSLFAESKAQHSLTDFKTKSHIDALSSQTNGFLMFQNNTFFSLNINEFNETIGKFKTVYKNFSQQISKEFFKFPNQCFIDLMVNPDVITSEDTSITYETSEMTDKTELKPSKTPSPVKNDQNGKAFSLWIIIAVIIIFLILLAIALFACLAMRKKEAKTGEDVPYSDVKQSQSTASTGASKAGTKFKSKVDGTGISEALKKDFNPSTISMRSTTDLKKNEKNTKIAIKSKAFEKK